MTRNLKCIYLFLDINIVPNCHYLFSWGSKNTAVSFVIKLFLTGHVTYSDIVLKMTFYDNFLKTLQDKYIKWFPFLQLWLVVLLVERQMFILMTLKLPINFEDCLSENQSSVCTGFMSSLMLKDKIQGYFWGSMCRDWHAWGLTCVGSGKGLCLVRFFKNVFLNCAKIFTKLFSVYLKGPKCFNLQFLNNIWITRKHFTL